MSAIPHYCRPIAHNRLMCLRFIKAWLLQAQECKWWPRRYAPASRDLIGTPFEQSISSAFFFGAGLEAVISHISCLDVAFAWGSNSSLGLRGLPEPHFLELKDLTSFSLGSLGFIQPQGNFSSVNSSTSESVSFGAGCSDWEKTSLSLLALFYALPAANHT